MAAHIGDKDSPARGYTRLIKRRGLDHPDVTAYPGLASV
jgi:hypothetical protein